MLRRNRLIRSKFAHDILHMCHTIFLKTSHHTIHTSRASPAAALNTATIDHNNRSQQSMAKRHSLFMFFEIVSVFHDCHSNQAKQAYLMFNLPESNMAVARSLPLPLLIGFIAYRLNIKYFSVSYKPPIFLQEFLYLRHTYC